MVVLVPLVGFGVSAVGSVRSANRTAAAADEIRDAAVDITELTSTQAALYVEHFWAGTLQSVLQSGATPELVAPLLGFDVTAELDAARDQVDVRLAQLPDAELRRQVDDARAAGASDNGEPGAYGEAERTLDDRVHDRLADLDRATDGVPGTKDLAQSANVLVAAVDLRRQVFLLTANLFGVRFPDQAVTHDPREGLVAARADYVRASERFEAVLEGQTMEGLATQLRDDPRTADLEASVQRAVTSVLRGESVVPVPANSVADFANALAVLGIHLDAVTSASDRVVEQATSVAARADDQRAEVYLTLGLVTAATILTLAVVGRWIVGSIEGIAVSANAMNDGDLDRPAPVRGPREVRAAAVALNTAAAHLRSAEAQALALAGDDLGAVSPTAATGALGRSMQEAMASLAVSLQEREELRRRLQHEALHDGLTGLPNRTSIVAGLDAALADRAGRPGRVAVLFIDCDGFKLVNDQHGHAAGDRVLCAIADRILDSVRAGDLVGRLGGDEFVVVADPISGEREARALAGRIREAVRQPIETGTSVVTPAVSIGVALSTVGTTPAQILHDADLAVYEAKALGSGAIEVCSEELRRAAADRQAVEVQLREAIDDDTLRVHFQPVVSALTHEPVEVEALVRWPEGLGPERRPSDFVAVAERSDLITQLDRWVIERTISILGDRSGPLGHARAAVNLSARHASTRPFAATILDALSRHEVDPRRLVVELTESALLADVDHVVTQLDELRRAGVRVAIDDFGTGYTSLSLLHRLPVDQLKLDRGMTAGLGRPEVAAVVRLIVDTAHLIGMNVVAEGVETTEQAEELVELGVDLLQGFLFARPAPAEDLPAIGMALDGPPVLR